MFVSETTHYLQLAEGEGDRTSSCERRRRVGRAGRDGIVSDYAQTVLTMAKTYQLHHTGERMVRNRNKAGKILSKYRLEVPLSDAHQIIIARCHTRRCSSAQTTRNGEERRSKGQCFKSRGAIRLLLQVTASLPPSYASKPLTLCRGK